MTLRWIIGAGLGLAMAACGDVDSYAIDVEVIVPEEVQAEAELPQRVVFRRTDGGNSTAEVLRTLCEPSGEDEVVEWHRSDIGCGPNWILDAWLEPVSVSVGCHPSNSYMSFGDAPLEDAPQASVVTFDGQTDCPTGRDFLRLRLAVP